MSFLSVCLTNNTHYFNIYWNFADREPWYENATRIRLSDDRAETMVGIRLQDSHAEGVPEVLLANDAHAGIPAMGIEVVTVSENYEDPC